MKSTLATLCTLIALAGGASAAATATASTSSEIRKQCELRTGLSAKDIRDYHRRNDGCVIDCTTRQGTLMSYFARRGEKCGEQEGYICTFGKCQSREEPLIVNSDLYSIEVSIKSAHVPDLDSLPMGGSSDTFVLVKAEKDSHPSYEDDEILCHTYVVQDNSDPKWTFKCKPLPLRLSSRVRFELFDSDKPSDVHDYIGSVTRTVEELMNKGTQKLQLLYKGSEDGHDYNLVVQVTGQEFDKKDEMLDV